jgi:poly-beta-1,6-N-acetyl-D-glucosamine synthase
MIDVTWMLVVAAVSLALLLYTYAGYPVLIALLARVWPKRRTGGAAAWRPTVSVLLPVANASRFVDEKLASLATQDYRIDQILVYDDGSSDDTVARVRAAAAADPRIELIEGGQRRGKPTALNRMLAQARGEVLLMTDARQPLATGALAALIEALADPRVGCATGNLVMRGATGASAYWKYEKWIRENEGRFSSMVGVSGALYALRRADLAPLPEDVLNDDMWVPMRLRLQRRDIVFVPRAEFYDDAFDDDKEFKRKVRTLAGNYQLMALLPRLLVPIANPSFLEYMSHKVARLACPLALIGLAGATAFALARTPDALWITLAGGQGAFYLGALVGGVLPGPAGKLGRLARTFVVLNAAALVGFIRWASGGQKITW